METPTFENLRRFFERIKNAGLFERIFSWKAIVSLGYDAFGEYQGLQKLVQEKDQQIAGLSGQGRDLTQARDHYQRQATQLQQDLSSEQLRIRSLNEKITEKERERATLAEAQANSEDHILRLKSDMVTLAAKNEDLQAKINERENLAGGLVAADKKNQQAITQLKEDVSAYQGRYDQLNSQFIDAQKTIAELRQKEEERVREHDARVTGLVTLKKQLEDDRIRVQAERDEEIRSEFADREEA
jgi:chromosome segregation ATPase